VTAGESGAYSIEERDDRGVIPIAVRSLTARVGSGDRGERAEQTHGGPSPTGSASRSQAPRRGRRPGSPSASPRRGPGPSSAPVSRGAPPGCRYLSCARSMSRRCGCREEMRPSAPGRPAVAPDGGVQSPGGLGDRLGVRLSEASQESAMSSALCGRGGLPSRGARPLGLAPDAGSQSVLRYEWTCGNWRSGVWTLPMTPASSR